ncbi:uncharacterized protein LOC126564719 [Anopheles maculipalpis]|uniref:uncharacterized protein LOC126564719 n=1 Tax=Anopheles maculipalpis TaxID=1496333 RepID=UPI002158ADB6|nr:uncharacterized protein LOC126564719 [Anopheles maculipalpis]
MANEPPKLPHATLNKLLHLVRENTEIYLPLDSRTLLKTPLQVGKEIFSIAGGQHWYQGIQNALRNYYQEVTPALDAFKINLSMDGLPLHNSGGTQFWPILMQVHNDPKAEVLVLGAYCGTSKPENAEGYLRPNVTFEGVGRDRTDAEFRSGIYAGGHQKRPSPVSEFYDLNVILDIVVGDRLHAIDLDVTKKLLKGLVLGFLPPFPKWSSYEQEEISFLLSKIEIPGEIHRKLRTLKHLTFWKGSEFSIFLHYARIPILKGRISEKAFYHFTLYYVAITLLSSKVYKQYYTYAGELLKQFVEEFSKVYGAGHVTSNVHNLLHIAAEVNRFGPLSTFSMYPFENKLKLIKDCVPKY